MTFILHGATGAQGSPVHSRLLAQGFDARAATRNADAGSNIEKSVSVDLADVRSLVAAYTGADGVFVHLPLGGPEQLRGYAEAIVTAVQEAKPSRVVVSTSGQVVDDQGSPLQAPDDSAIMTLIRGIQASGVSLAVVAPRLFLENLLLPVVAAPAKEEGVLRYPLPADFPVSWSSHLDVAEVVARLLTTSSDLTGVISVGQRPGLVGADLAAGFSTALGRDVWYEALTPGGFGEIIEPLFGAEGAAPVVGLYTALNAEGGFVIAKERSAQRLLGLEPLTITDWLSAINGE